MKSSIHCGFILAMAAGLLNADTLALVAADSTLNEDAAQAAFIATGKFSTVTIIDTQTSTPVLADLQGFTHVLAWSSAAPHDRLALGNVLADYYDLPGKHLTVATYAYSTIPSVAPFFLPDPEIQGRVSAAPYAGFTNSGLIGDLSGSLVPAMPGDPIWAGIDLTQVFYFENQYMAHPSLAAGATLIAADGSGGSAIGLISRSQNGVTNVNFYPGAPQGESAGNNSAALFKLLTNTFPSAPAVTDTIPPTSSAAAQPAPNAKGWNNSNPTVVITAIDNPSGSGVKQISVSLTGAQTGSNVVAGNSASVSITAEGTTTVTYFATDNAGNVESPKTLTVLLDKTPPTATATVNPAPNSSGVNTTAPVTVTFTGTDSLSGINSCTLPIPLTASGTATGTCTDNAGNTSAPVSKTVTIVDPPPAPGPTTGSTGPVIHGVPDPGKCVLRPGSEMIHAATLWVDAGKASSFAVTATSSESQDKDNDDIRIRGTGLQPREIWLRAEFLKKGTDLIYTITAKAANQSGQTTVTFACTETHPKDTDDDDKNHDPGKH